MSLLDKYRCTPEEEKIHRFRQTFFEAGSRAQIFRIKLKCGDEGVGQPSSLPEGMPGSDYFLLRGAGTLYRIPYTELEGIEHMPYTAKLTV